MFLILNFIGNENISTGGLSKEFFLGTVLFLIFIMIMILVVKILNTESIKKEGKTN